MINTKELMLGNWVLAGKNAKFPMQVVSIFENEVYLLGIEEKPKCEFKQFDRVLVKDVNCDIWHADIFSHVDMFGRYICVGRSWSQCIPYNEQTAHLLGTTENYN